MQLVEPLQAFNLYNTPSPGWCGLHTGKFMNFKMACPKCGSENLNAERDYGSYVRGGAMMVKCYMCGKRIYGEQNIEAEYKKQLKEWKVAQPLKDKMAQGFDAAAVARKKAAIEARGAREAADRVHLAEKVRLQRDEKDKKKTEAFRMQKEEADRKRRIATEKAENQQTGAEGIGQEIQRRKQEIARKVLETQRHMQEIELRRKQKDEDGSLLVEKARLLEEKARLLLEKEAEEARLQAEAEQRRKDEELRQAAEAERQRELQRVEGRRVMATIQAAKTDIQIAQERMVAIDTQILELQQERVDGLATIQSLQALLKTTELPMIRLESARQMAALRAGNPLPRIMVVCSYCDDPFYKLPGDAKKNKSGHFYCCPEHFTLWRRKQRDAVAITLVREEPQLIAKPSAPKGRVTVTCDHCGAPVSKTAGEVARSKTQQFFCNRAHHQLWLKANPDVFRQMAYKQAATRRGEASSPKRP